MKDCNSQLCMYEHLLFNPIFKFGFNIIMKRFHNARNCFETKLHILHYSIKSSHLNPIQNSFLKYRKERTQLPYNTWKKGRDFKEEKRRTFQTKQQFTWLYCTLQFMCKFCCPTNSSLWKWLVFYILHVKTLFAFICCRCQFFFGFFCLNFAVKRLPRHFGKF